MQERCIQYITKENLLLREDLLGHFFLIGLGGASLWFSNYVFSTERVNTWLFGAFNIIISYFFPENFIGIS